MKKKISDTKISFYFSMKILINIINPMCTGQNKQKKYFSFLHPASFRKFATLLTNKANKYNITFIKANRYYASTKKCSCCGSIKVMEIDDRTYKCEECNLVIDRDLNAAINLAIYN